MQILAPNEVKRRYGPFFSRGFYTLVDEKQRLVRIIEICSAKGPVEWDALNRRRAQGALINVIVDGTTLVMDAKVGKGKVRFGPSSSISGGQALKSVEIKGNEVHTTWIGIAGASIGIGACLPQSPGVIRTEYKNGEIHLGGSNRTEVTIVTPKKVRLIIGIDDSDTKEEGATWVLGLNMVKVLHHVHLLNHKIIQLNPKIREKTTSCASTAVAFAVDERYVDKVLSEAVDYVKRYTRSNNTSIAAYTGLKIPLSLRKYGVSSKINRLNIEIAESIARKCGVRLISVTGNRGKIGALAAIGCFDMGLYSAGLPSDRYLFE